MAWVYPRPQGWFEEMYRNPVMFSLWKNDFRVSKETFDYICQLVGPYLSRQNTRLRKAIPLNKRVSIALWKFSKVKKCFSKFMTRCYLNKQSLDKRAINHAFSDGFTIVNFAFILPPLLTKQTRLAFTRKTLDNNDRDQVEPAISAASCGLFQCYVPKYGARER